MPGRSGIRLPSGRFCPRIPRIPNALLSTSLDLGAEYFWLLRHVHSGVVSERALAHALEAHAGALNLSGGRSAVVSVYRDRSTPRSFRNCRRFWLSSQGGTSPFCGAAAATVSAIRTFTADATATRTL
jgi:hypothetical protein